MAGNLITVTDAGREALVAPGNAGTSAHRIVEIGLATAAFVADRSMKALPNERKRITTFAGENVAPDTIHVTLQDDTTDQYTLYGFGLYLENGVLLAAYSQGREDQALMEKSPAAMLLLSVDLLFATIDATTLVFGDASFSNPPATTELQGVVELATQAEVDAGTDDMRAVTPKTAAQRYAALAGAQFCGSISVQDIGDVGDNAKRAQISTDATTAYYHSAGHTVLGSVAVDGETSLVAGNQIALRVLPNGHALVGATADDGVGLLQVAGLVTAQTPPAGDASKKLATTEFVISAIGTASIGQIVMESRTTARAGFLKLNGVELNRADYPALWAYAQASGTLVTDTDWVNYHFGCFSSGDGVATFRIPELRGEFLRCWDDGRGIDPSRSIGTGQATQNLQHNHDASADWVNDHVHSAWTDAQGWHGHGVNDPGHAHSVPSGAATGSGGSAGAGTAGGLAGQTTYSSGTGISIARDGNHTHNVGIGGGGNHSHNISIQPNGGSEARPRNIALLAMIRAY